MWSFGTLALLSGEDYLEAVVGSECNGTRQGFARLKSEPLGLCYCFPSQRYSLLFQTPSHSTAFALDSESCIGERPGGGSESCLTGQEEAEALVQHIWHAHDGDELLYVYSSEPLT